MTRKSKKYLIATETHEVLILRGGRDKLRGFCSECCTEVEMLNLDSAVTFSGRHTREIFSQIESGKIHSFETTNGLLLVCRNSLQGEIK